MLDRELLGRRIKERRKYLNMTQGDIATAIGVAISTIQRYEAAAIDAIKLPVVEAIARTLRVSPDWLVGKTDVMECQTPAQTNTLPPNCKPITMKPWRVLGATACGQPLHKELSEDTLDAPDDIKADFAFRCDGDSMIGARIMDGDWVFVRSQPEVENGQVAVVRVADEYTLKRVYRGADYLELRAENPKCPPLLYREAEMNSCEIVGLAVKLLSNVI